MSEPPKRGRRGRATRGLWLARPGRGRTGRRHRRAGCAPVRPGAGEADGAAAGARSLHVDPDRAGHVAARPQPGLDRRHGQRHRSVHRGRGAAQGIGGAAKVCLAASVFMMIFCVLRLGRYVAKVPHAVVSGFSCGVGAMMVILQLRTLLGLPCSPSEARRKLRWASLFRSRRILPQIRWEPLLLGLIVVAGAVVAARRWPRSPAPLLGVVLAVAAGYAPGLARAAAGGGVAVVAVVRRVHLGPDRRHLGLAGGAWAGVRGFGQHPDHVARRRALPGPAPAASRGRRRRRARRLRDRQPLRRRLRGTAFRRHPGPQPGQPALRRNDAAVEPPARRILC